MSLSAGRLSYDVDPQKRELSVRVTDMLEDYSYYLRLCRRKDFICAGTGVNKLVSASFLLESDHGKWQRMVDGPQDLTYLLTCFLFKRSLRSTVTYITH